jgi:16S rRNA processing protein RimM
MRVDDCYQLGYVTKTHGLKGEIQIMLDVDNPAEYTNLESMFVLRNNTLIPFFIDHIQVNGNKALVKLDEVDDVSTAKDLVSSEIYLPLSLLPELSDEQFYFHEIIGYQFFDKENLIGEVKNVYAIAPQTLIEVDHNGVDVLVPLNDEVIKKVAKNESKVYAELPEGLLDVYTSSHED